MTLLQIKTTLDGSPFLIRDNARVFTILGVREKSTFQYMSLYGFHFLPAHVLLFYKAFQKYQCAVNM